MALGGAGDRTDEDLAALAEQLENDPNTHVTCDLGIDVREGEACLAIGGHSDFNGRRVQIDGLIGTGPAGEAGLLAGDYVVAVDGEAMAGLELPEVVDAIGGPAGTEVSLTVERDGQELHVDIVREALTPG